MSDKRNNRLIGNIKGQITRRLNKPMPIDVGLDGTRYAEGRKREIQYSEWIAKKYDVLGKYKNDK